MLNTLKMVDEFHKKFNLPRFWSTPYTLDTKTNKLRLSLLREEVDELEEAIEAQDLDGMLDALTDIQYVLDGTYISLGFAKYKDEAFKEVHASNMSKLGEDGRPIYREDGKVVKGPNYFKPNLSKAVNLANATSELERNLIKRPFKKVL